MISKTHGLLWLENLRESQKLTSREEKRKEEILEMLRELYNISNRRFEPPDFPPWRSHW